MMQLIEVCCCSECIVELQIYNYKNKYERDPLVEITLGDGYQFERKMNRRCTYEDVLFFPRDAFIQFWIQKNAIFWCGLINNNSSTLTLLWA